MVVESLLSPEEAEKRWLWVFGLGFAYASIALFIALWIFRESAGLVMVFLTTVAALPLFYRIMKLEEGKDLVIRTEKGLLHEHGRAIRTFLAAFLGMSAAFAFWYVVLPTGMVAQIFQIQSQTIVTINKGVTGNFARVDLFSKIFLNNVEVLFFCLLFSFIYGAGSIFILAWNASVIGVALGNFFRGSINAATSLATDPSVVAYATAMGGSTLRYLVHGIPEIIAYLIGALAGGIVSVAIVNRHFRGELFEKLLLDSTDLIMIALSFLLAAAMIEVYITPVFFM